MSLDTLTIILLREQPPDAFDAKSSFIADRRRFSGSTIKENCAGDITVDGGPHDSQQEMVLRTDSPYTMAARLSRVGEFELLRAAWQAGCRSRCLITSRLALSTGSLP